MYCWLPVKITSPPKSAKTNPGLTPQVSPCLWMGAVDFAGKTSLLCPTIQSFLLTALPPKTHQQLHVLLNTIMGWHQSHFWPRVNLQISVKSLLTYSSTTACREEPMFSNHSTGSPAAVPQAWNWSKLETQGCKCWTQVYFVNHEVAVKLPLMKIARWLHITSP